MAMKFYLHPIVPPPWTTTTGLWFHWQKWLGDSVQDSNWLRHLVSFSCHSLISNLRKLLMRVATTAEILKSFTDWRYRIFLLLLFKNHTHTSYFRLQLSVWSLLTSQAWRERQFPQDVPASASWVSVLFCSVLYSAAYVLHILQPLCNNLREPLSPFGVCVL